MNEPVHLSVVSPVYGASQLLDELVSRIEKAAQSITPHYEIILVEDRGPDDSWEVIERICAENRRVIGIRHSRNFGQQYALKCGLDHSRGEWVVTLDCDLQDTPEEIVNLYNKAKEGCDIVLAHRVDRQDDFLKKLFSRLFYSALSYLTDTHQDPSVANFALYRRKVVDALASMGDYYRYYPTMIRWVGFPLGTLAIKHAERSDGKRSSYSFKKRLDLAINTIIAFSDKPLRLTVKAGFIIMLVSVLFSLLLIFRYFATGIEVAGWTSTFASLWFLSGLLMSVLGLVGIYIGRIFESVKQRPAYIVDEVRNLGSDKGGYW